MSWLTQIYRAYSIFYLFPFAQNLYRSSINSKLYMSDISSENLRKINFSDFEQAFLEEYQPEKSLVIYGTLAPNAPNHSVIEHIKGNWQKGIIRGRLTQEGWGAELGYYGFKHASKEEQKEIKVYILFSEELGANWQFLDEFEGNGYKRILTKYELENGLIGVGNIYAINAE